MLSGVFITLKSSVLGIYFENLLQRAVMLPEGATVQIPSTPTGRMMDVIWQGRTVSIFTADIREHSHEKDGDLVIDAPGITALGPGNCERTGQGIPRAAGGVMLRFAVLLLILLACAVRGPL